MCFTLTVVSRVVRVSCVYRTMRFELFQHLSVSFLTAKKPWRKRSYIKRRYAACTECAATVSADGSDYAEFASATYCTTYNGDVKCNLYIFSRMGMARDLRAALRGRFVAAKYSQM